MHADFDAIVVGSGISGGWAAKELTERGLKVLLLERGRDVVHGTDYVGEHKAPWELKFRGLNDRQKADADYPVQKLARAFEEGSTQFFVNDREHPYQSDSAHPFTWIRGHHVGGRSLTWGRCSLRIGEFNLTEPARDGQGLDWPFRYGDIDRWYTHVEDFAGISGTREGLEVVPDGQFLPPIPLNCVEEHVGASVRKHFPGRTLIPERTAVLSVNHRGRAACHYCGPCYRGCATGSYFSSQSSTLPAARATGNLTLRAHAIVEGVDHDPATKRASGVRTIDGKTGERRTFTAKLIFLNASTVATTQILLNSRSEAFPNGLANRSGVLGHYLMDHVMGPLITARMPGFTDQQPLGNRPSGFYIPRFRNVARNDSPFIRGYGFQGRAWRETWTRGPEIDAIGADLKAELRKPGPWHVMIGGMGECLPYVDNQITLDERQTDKWGIPQVRIRFEWRGNEKAMAEDMVREGAAMLAAAGGEITYQNSALVPGGLAIHEMGTARMGRDPANSVLNAHNQAHDVANLFVTDGACMPGSAAQNPSLTYMALTARACEYAVAQLKAGAI